MCSILEGVEEAEVLGDGEDGALGLLDVGIVPLEELGGCFDVFRDWFLGEDVLPCGEGFLDICWLDGDGEAASSGISILYPE